MNSAQILDLNSIRRFGVEMEVNAFDMREKPLGYFRGDLPEGIDYIANLVKNLTNENVVIHRHGNDHYNDCWIVKPDSSCGMEICSPVLKGKSGIRDVYNVVQGLSLNEKVNCDRRCSFHVHVDVADLDDEKIATIATWWIKCEPVFMDAMPDCRKINRYCELIGYTDILPNIEQGFYTPNGLLSRLGENKYHSINTFHYCNGKRKSLEFRIMDNLCCVDAASAKSWIVLILHFVERALITGMPVRYENKNQWSGYCWLDPWDVFKLLGFIKGDFELSETLIAVRKWFLYRLNSFGKNSKLLGIMSDLGRKFSIKDVDRLNLDLNT